MAKGKLTVKDRQNIETIYGLFDTDSHHDFISEKEMKTGLSLLFGDDYTTQEFKKIYKDMGLNAGDKITKEKFKSFMEDYCRRPRKTRAEKKAEIESAFRVFDKNGNGSIDKTELTKSLKQLDDKMSDKEIEQLFTLLDTDKDGKITSKEYVDLLLKDFKEPK